MSEADPGPQRSSEGLGSDEVAWSDLDWLDRRRRHRVRRRSPKQPWYRPRNITIGVVVLVLVLVAAYLFALNHMLNDIRRAPLRPTVAGPASVGENILVIGSDVPERSLRVDRGTSVIQLVHLSADHRTAAVIHFPRELYLPVPGLGRQPLFAAFRSGDAPLLVETLQQDLGVNIDHVVQVGFRGYAGVTDRIGGVDVPTSTGVRHLDGEAALAWNDATTGLVGGDIDTGHRNQDWIKAMLGGVLSPGVLVNPLKVLGIVHDLSSHVVVDSSFTTGHMRSLAWSSRNLRPSTIRYLTAPYVGYAPRHGNRVLLPDTVALRQLGAAVRADSYTGIAPFDN